MMKTAFDILKRQREAEAEVWKHFPAIQAEIAALSAKVAERLIIEGHVAILDGEIVDIRAPDPDAGA